MANYVYIGTSIDGYIATEDHGIEWLNDIPNPDNSDFGFADFMARIDALVMGRNTFEVIRPFGEWPYNKPVFVLSASMAAIPESHADKAEIIRGTPREVLAQLHGRGFRNLYIDGGKTIQSFLDEDLIDEMTITQLPIVLGRGIPLFAPTHRRLKFAHVSTEVLHNTLVKTTFARMRSDE